MNAGTVRLLDHDGQWTHRDKHQHHRFSVQVPENTVELRIRFRWGPLDMGRDHEENALSLTLFDPNGFRGAALRTLEGQEISIGGSATTPGCLPGPIPGGTWTLNIDSNEVLNDGAETGFLTFHVDVSARIGDATAPAKHAEAAILTPHPPAGGTRWYRGELHTHTTHSDGTISVEDRARGAVDDRLDFLAITDHNTISQHREVDRWPDGITPIRGCEVTTFHGHMNCFGLGAPIDWREDARGSGAAAIVEQAHRQGALISINHPNAFGDPWCSGCHWDYAQVDFATFDAVEVWNGRWAIPETGNEGALALWTDLLDSGFRPTAIAGSDSHSAEEDAYVALPRTYVQAPDPSESSILDGIRLGRVFISSGPTVTFRATGSDGVDVTLPGSEQPLDGPFWLAVEVAGVEFPATLWYVESGSRVPLGPCGPGPTSLDGREVTATQWWRLELREGAAENGDLLALTNPVYVAPQ